MKKRILLIEDTKALAENMADILENLEFEVRIAGNGHEALSMLAEFRPDLVITDVVMPAMDGIEFTESIRKMTDFIDIPVIMLSARTTPEDVRRGKSAGANEYLTKPCTVPVLMESIERLLKP